MRKLTRRKFFAAVGAGAAALALPRVVRPTTLTTMPGKWASISYTTPRYSVTAYAMSLTVSAAAVSATNFHSLRDAVKVLNRQGGGTVYIAPGHTEILTEPIVLG